MLSRLGSGVALASVAALVLVGCTPDEPVETTTPPSVEPTAAEQERLEEARATWDAYQDVLSGFAAAPETATIDPLLDVASKEVAEAQLVNISEAESVGARVEGTRVTTFFEPLTEVAAGDGLSVSVCIDTSNERVYDFEDNEIPRNPDTLLRSQAVEFQWDQDADRYLVSSDSEFAGQPEDDPCN